MTLHCRHLAKDGICTGRYEGYACIKEQCSLVKQSKKRSEERR
ncbi:MAG: hypothetical protein QG582_780, partial [Candidatus Thermoplasmatota archaeon]|nr:hypothetical protein [Candidatus Thermoplasmatota archaeon]